MKKINTFILILFVNLFLPVKVTSQIPSYVPSNGLIGWWPFNGNANDESGNMNNGTVNGATLTMDRFGNTNKAYSFDGIDDWITIPSNSSLDNISLASFNFWMKSTQLTSGNLFKKGNSQNVSSAEQFNYQINQINQNQSGFVTKYNSNCVPGNGWVTNYANQNIVDNNWYMITGVIKNNSTLYYINGNLISLISTPNNSMDICNGGAINFGRNWDSDLDQYNGILDDVGFWNRALTQEEITALYTGVLTSESFINTNDFEFYPNPANDFVQFKHTEIVLKISIYNTLGQLVEENKPNSMEGGISIEHLAQGSYFVKVNNQSKSYTLLKKREFDIKLLKKY